MSGQVGASFHPCFCTKMVIFFAVITAVYFLQNLWFEPVWNLFLKQTCTCKTHARFLFCDRFVSVLCHMLSGAASQSRACRFHCHMTLPSTVSMCGAAILPLRLRFYSSQSSKEPPGSSGGDKKVPSSSKSGAGSGDKGGDKKGGSQWWCPKCGDPCTHVDTFVCK